MKKGLAIFLLAVTLYNVGGYILAFQYFIFKADKYAEQQISKDRFKETDLVEIKIPTQLPGIDPWRGYEAVSGAVQLSQNTYNYVRMKMTRDTIFIMCIPNYKTTKLKKDNVICAREVSDAPLNTKKQTSPVKGVNLVKYIAIVTDCSCPPHHGLTLALHRDYACKPLSALLDNPAQPPESFSC